MTNKEKYFLVKVATKMKTVELSGEVQGIGLRRTVHGKLDELGVKGLALNDARTNNVYLTVPESAMEEVLAAIKARQVEKGEEVGRVLPELEVKEVKKPSTFRDIKVTPGMVQKFIDGQGLTQFNRGDYGSYATSAEQWIGDRYRLTEDNGTLTGTVPALARKQLKAKEPIYQGQIDKPEEWGEMSWSLK